jgi:DHA2 family multidrug resistance protein
VVGLGALQTVLERGETEDWFSKRYIVVLTVLASVSLVSFVVRELMTEHPVVDLRVLRSRKLAICASLTFVLGFSLYATVFIVPVFTQRLLGYTAMETGMLFLPGALVALFFLPIMGRLLMKGFPPQVMVVVGFMIVAIFAGRLSLLNLNAQSSDFFWPIILRALGLSLVTIPLTQLAVSGLHQRDIPQGVALNNMMRQMGGSFGIAFINTFLDHRTAAHRLDLVSRLSPGDPATDGRLAGLANMLVSKGATTWEASHRALALLEATIQRQSNLLSYLDAYRLVAFLSLACVPLILFAGRSRKLTREAAAAAEAH